MILLTLRFKPPLSDQFKGQDSGYCAKGIRSYITHIKAALDSYIFLDIFYCQAVKGCRYSKEGISEFRNMSMLAVKAYT